MEATTARQATIVAVAWYTGTDRKERGAVQIWNWSTGDRLSHFETVFDGMGRQRLSPDGESYVAANWKKGKYGGIACYNTRTGERAWHRDDLRHVQGVRFSPLGDRLWCRVDDGPAHCFDAKTGLLLSKIRSAYDVVESPYSDLAFHSRRGADYLLVSRTTKTVPRLSPALTADAAFSADALCVTEYCGPVRCIDCESGKERWRYEPPQGFHVTELLYQADQAFYGLLFGYRIPEAAILRFSLSEGKCTEVCHYELSKRYGGSFGNGVFVAATGEVLSLVDGQILRHLGFPRQ